MQIRIAAAVLASSAVLSGCGGGATDAPSESRAPAQSQQSQQAQQAQVDPTTGALRVYRAFFGRPPTAAEYNALTTPDAAALATGFAAGFATTSDGALSTAVLSNLGVSSQSVNSDSYSILQLALTQYFAAYGPSARGVIVNNLVGLLAGLESDATWGAPARAFNAEVNAARALVAASTSTGGACVPSVTTGFADDIETAPAGDGGSAGSGGGAAAGGGLGKVLAGAMSVMDLSTGNVVGQGITDSATGLVTIRTCSLPGPFLLTLEGRAGARYFDEGKNTLVDFPAGSVLHALVDQWNEHVGVSPLTEAAYRYALNNFKASAADIAAGRSPLRAEGILTGLTASQVRSANELVAAEINKRLTTTYQVLSATALPTPIDGGSSSTSLGSSRYGRSAAANGGLVQAANHFNPALASPALSLAADLSRDLTDGRIDGFALDGLAIGSADRVSYESTRLPLAGTIGGSSVLSRFGQTQLQATGLRVEEESWVASTGKFDPLNPDRVDCDGFRDDVALLSDASVTVLRRFPTNTGTSCVFAYDAAENARVVKIRNFVTGVKTLSHGSTVGYAVKTDGTVVGWGDNYCGRLSPTLPNGRYSQPQVIAGLSNITAIDGDDKGVIARDNGGSVYYWSNRGAGAPPAGWKVCEVNAGVLDGRPYDQIQPIAMAQASLADVIQVYGTGANFFALTATGDVYGWGEGFAGLLANSDGTVVGSFLRGASIDQPTRIAGLSRVRQLAFANFAAFALQYDGQVLGWGDDDLKLLGNGVQRRVTRPTPVAGLSDIATIAGNRNGLRMLRRDGTPVAWGDAGSLGRSPEIYVPTNVPVSDPVRHVVGRFAGWSVYFASGRVARDVNQTNDVAPNFR